MFYSSDPTTELAAGHAASEDTASAAGHAASGDSAPVTEDDRELQVLSIVHGAQTRAKPGSDADPDADPNTGAAENTGPDPHSGQEHDAPARVSQRSIAQALGMSVGLTNAILKRLTDKGFLMMRRINAHNVHYLPGHSLRSLLGHASWVTPAGVDLISRRSYLYLRRTIGHVVRYKERLREFCRTQRDRGIREIVLIPWSESCGFLLGYASKAIATSPSSSNGARRRRGSGFDRWLLGPRGRGMG